MKNSKVKLVAIILATTMASVFFTGCSQANERNEESSNENIVVSLVSEEDLEESSEEETSVEESVVESEVESSVESEVVSAESSVESEVVSAESSVESEVVSVESSVESEVSDGESSVEESVHYSLSDIIRYGKTLTVTPLKVNGEYLNTLIEVDSNVAIVRINSDTYDIYFKGQVATVEASKVELYPEDYIPDFSPEIDWYGFTFEERGSLINSN